jgi:hypothetical protein
VRSETRSSRASSASRRLLGTWRPPLSAISRPSSSANSGLPPESSCTRASCGRVRSAPRESRNSRCRSLMLNADSRISSARSAPNSAAGSNGARTSGAWRTVASTFSRSPVIRRSASGNTCAVDESNHCRSSIATSTSPSAQSAVRTSRSASPIACAAGGASPGSSRSKATRSARRRGAGSAASTWSSTGPTRSASPVNASAASAPAARCTSTLVTCAVASSTAICHSSVLPIPGSPRSTNDCNSGPARNPPRRSSSDSRATTRRGNMARSIIPDRGRRGPRCRGFQVSRRGSGP